MNSQKDEMEDCCPSITLLKCRVMIVEESMSWERDEACQENGNNVVLPRRISWRN
jgi:hypothetical protein